MGQEVGHGFSKWDFGPSIYLSPRDRAFPARCPACRSSRYDGSKVCVNEDSTFALNPSPGRLRYQRYVRLTCAKCHYTYHIRPEGLWYQKALPPTVTSMIFTTEIPVPADARDLRPTKDSEEGFARSEALGHEEIHPPPEQESEDERARWSRLPLVVQPKPEFNLLLKAPWPVAIARRQDERIVDLGQTKRFTDLPLNARLTNSKIAVLTGAGFSVPLGLPAMTEYRERLPKPTQRSLVQLRQRHRWIRCGWLDDAEILTDLLLRLQRIAVLSPTLKSFEDHVDQLPFLVESIFAFREQHANDWMSYPPLAHCVVAEELHRNRETDHYRTVRETLYQVVSTLLLRCYQPEKASPTVAAEGYRLFLSSLSRCNGGPVPLFTTNFDRAVEEMYCQAGDASRIATGAGRKIRLRPRIQTISPTGATSRRRIPYTCRTVNSQGYATVENEEIAVFHLHGCPNWFVDLTTGNTIDVEAPDFKALEGLFRVIWNSPNSWQPACIVPATVKHHYTISPPFNFAYDYFAESLRRARLLVIIGQSLRDETLKEMILWAAQANHRLRFAVVDKDENAEEEAEKREVLRDCIPANKLVFYSGRGFPDAAQDVLGACAKLLDR